MQSPKMTEVLLDEGEGISRNCVHTVNSETPKGSDKRHFSLPSLSCSATGADALVPTYKVSPPTAIVGYAIKGSP
jgi:hypothetical protein